MMAGAWWFMRSRSVSLSETQGSATANATVMGPGGIINGNINGRYSESTTTTTTSPNYQAQQWAYGRAANQIEQAQDQASRVRKAALVANTLDPKAMAVGMLFFEYDKHAKEIIVRVELGRDLYEIPFQASQLAK